MRSGRAVIPFLPLLGLALLVSSLSALAATNQALISVRITVNRPLLAFPSEINRPSRADAVVWVFILRLYPATQRLTLHAQCVQDEDPEPFFLPAPTPGQILILLHAEIPMQAGCAALDTHRAVMETFLQSYRSLLQPMLSLTQMKTTFRDLLRLAYWHATTLTPTPGSISVWTDSELYRYGGMARNSLPAAR